MSQPIEPSSSPTLEPLPELVPPARLVLALESWNEVVGLVENPPQPTDDLRGLFDADR